MTGLHASRRFGVSPKISVLCRWVLVVTAASALGTLLGWLTEIGSEGALTDIKAGTTVIRATLASITGMLVFGTVLGLGQCLVFRSGWGRNLILLWLASTGIGWGLSSFTWVLDSWFFGRGPWPEVPALVAVIQWLALGRHLPGGWLWIPVSLLGATPLAIDYHSVGVPGDLHGPTGVAALGAIFGMAYGIATGALLFMWEPRRVRH